VAGGKGGLGGVNMVDKVVWDGGGKKNGKKREGGIKKR
jgi:hypothetical protein